MKSSIAGKRVLVVDDDRSLLTVIERMLAASGCAVDVCASFEDAKQAITFSAPDVLVTDVRLGAFNGLQLVILAKEIRPETIAVVMSAYDDAALRKEATQCGASYLQKPFTGEVMLNFLSSAAPPGEAIVT
jgi:two-component system response regulator HydG